MLNQEDMKFLTEYKKYQEVLEQRILDGEAFVWSPDGEVNVQELLQTT